MGRELGRRHQKTWQDLYARPTSSDIRWTAVEGLVRALGGELEERKGSRVAFILGDEVAVLHRPHPRPTISKADVQSVRKFLELAGFELEESA